MNIAEKYINDIEKINILLTSHDNDSLYIREEMYKQKESNMDNKVFAIFDIFDENLNGDLRDHLIGVYDSLSEARTQIEMMNLDNFRWLGARRCKFSKNGRAHMIIIDDFVINKISV